MNIKILADFQICISVTLTHLPKVFDFIKLNLLIAQLTDHGFDSQPLNYTFCFLSGTSHRNEINNAYSNYLKIMFGATEGSILRPSQSNIYTCDMFFKEYELDIASYDTDDDNNYYIYDPDLNIDINKLGHFTIKMYKGFKGNHLKANGDKCHPLVNKPMSINIESNIIMSSQ